MMKKISTLIILALLSMLNVIVYAQCEPLTPEQCPDPENNGEVCPDTLEPAFINQFYSQVATIKPPAVYYLPPDSTEISLHQVKLKEVGNLPEGITWQSNTTDSIFMAGEYYCVLMEGTPGTAGEYPLKIVVDVYILVFNVPVYVATAVDSTSLVMQVIDNSGIFDVRHREFFAEQNVPNPFSAETRISFYAENDDPVTFEIFTLLGTRVYAETMPALPGKNTITYRDQGLPAGTYLYRLRSGSYQSGGMMVHLD